MIRFKDVMALLDSLSLGIDLYRPRRARRRYNPMARTNAQAAAKRGLRAKIDAVEKSFVADWWRNH